MAKKTVTASHAGKGSVSKENLLKEIEMKAYELFLNRNRQHGNDLHDWLEAEKIVKKKYKL
jgi:hypothetical protein